MTGSLMTDPSSQNWHSIFTPKEGPILTYIVSTGVDIQQGNSDRGRRSSLSPIAHEQLLIPKNRSTGNLLAHGGTEKARIRFSFDAGVAAAEYDMSRLVPGGLVFVSENGL